MLGMLCALFAREQHTQLDFLDGIVAQEGKLLLKGKSQAGTGEFKQRGFRPTLNMFFNPCSFSIV